MDSTRDVAGALVRHTRTDVEPWGEPLEAPRCTECDDLWPCDASILAAEVERLRAELVNLRSVVALMDVDGERQRIRDDRVDAVVRGLCETHGYGAVMDSAARQWRAKDPVGALMIGPCVATVQAVMHDTPAGDGAEGR